MGPKPHSWQNALHKDAYLLAKLARLIDWKKIHLDQTGQESNKFYSHENQSVIYFTILKHLRKVYERIALLGTISNAWIVWRINYKRQDNVNLTSLQLQADINESVSFILRAISDKCANSAENLCQSILYSNAIRVYIGYPQPSANV